MNGMTACWQNKRPKKNRKNEYIIKYLEKRENIYDETADYVLYLSYGTEFGALELTGITLIQGNPLPLNVQDRSKRTLVP